MLRTQYLYQSSWSPRPGAVPDGVGAHPHADAGFSLRELYTDSMTPGFLGNRVGATTPVTRLCSHVMQLPPDGAAALGLQLQEAADRVWGGGAACAHQLEQLSVPLHPPPYPCSMIRLIASVQEHVPQDLARDCTCVCPCPGKHACV